MSNNLISKKYIQAPTTFQQDLDALLNSSAQAYVLKESPENRTEAIVREKRWSSLKRRYNIGYVVSAAILSCLGIISLVALLIFLISYVSYGKNYVAIGMAISLMILVGVCICAGFISSLAKNEFYIDVSNYNDEYFQFRLLPDNRLYILGGANFDENGETLAMNYITEMEPIYSDLIIMDSIDLIKQVKEGAVIKGLATFRSYRINNGVRFYIEMEKKQQMTIFLQAGIYSQEMLQQISEKCGVHIRD